MALVSGTLFLLGLHRRALADCRLHVLEAGATAAILGALSTVRFSEEGLALFGTASQVLWTAALAGLLWGAATAGVLHFAREEFRFYVKLTLLESGLLYLALEHEPAEVLRPLCRGTQPGRLAANPAGGVSFAKRMQALLRGYAACASAVGCQPYPAWSRYTASAMGALVAGLTVAAAWLVWSLRQVSELPELYGVDPAVVYSPEPGWILQGFGVVLLLCAAVYLLSAALSQAKRTAVMLALVDVLHGPVAGGRALLTRG